MGWYAITCVGEISKSHRTSNHCLFIPKETLHLFYVPYEKNISSCLTTHFGVVLGCFSMHMIFIGVSRFIMNVPHFSFILIFSYISFYQYCRYMTQESLTKHGQTIPRSTFCIARQSRCSQHGTVLFTNHDRQGLPDIWVGIDSPYPLHQLLCALSFCNNEAHCTLKIVNVSGGQFDVIL